MSNHEKTRPTHSAKQTILDTDVEVHRLSTGEKGFTKKSVQILLTGDPDPVRGDLAEILGAKSLKPFLGLEFSQRKSIEFYPSGSELAAELITTDQFFAILTAFHKAHLAKVLKGKRLGFIGVRASMILGAFAFVGINAWVDEVTGYQQERPVDDLQMKLNAFLAPHICEWEKTFPDKLWHEFARLCGLKFDPKSHRKPQFWAWMVRETIYRTLDPDIYEYIMRNRPPKGVMLHQMFNREFGAKKLADHIQQVIGIASVCQNRDEFVYKVQLHFLENAAQQTLVIPVPMRKGRFKKGVA